MSEPRTRSMADKRLSAYKNRKEDIDREFDVFVEQMGYEHFVESGLQRSLLLEFFVGGWGAKSADFRRKKKEKAKRKESKS